MKRSNFIYYSILVKALLDAIYILVISDVYRYVGFEYLPDLSRIILSYVLLVVIGFLIYREDNRASYLFIIFYYVLVIIPLLSLLGLQEIALSHCMMIISSFIILSYMTNSIRIGKIPQISQRSIPITVLVLVLITLSVLSMLVSTGGLSRMNFNVMDVYSVREGYSNSRNVFLAYFVPYQANVFNPIILTMGLYRKKILWVLLGITLQLLIFSMTNYKTFLFTPFLIIIVYYLLRNKPEINNFVKYTIIFMGLVLALALVFQSNILVQVFVRRLFFIPALLHLQYLDFFSVNQLVYLSDSIFESFVSYPYERSYVEIIGLEYYGKQAHANAGFIADAYANFGTFGLIFYPLFTSIVLVLIDTVTKSLPVYFCASFIIIYPIMLTNTGIISLLISHGLALGIVSLWIINRKLK